ncbi:MAG: hypothetical protein H7098_03470, partial [Oligoflexus sp.]|nr:hypothetical protein [Pseudopedobacter sp.]
MDNLQTNDLIALSLLLDEEIYLIKDEQIKHSEKDVSNTEIAPEIHKAEEISLAKQVPDVKIEMAKETIAIPAIPKIEEEIKTSKPEYKYLGDNNKYFLIIVNEPNFDFLNKKDLAFLTKILGAKKLDINDVAIVNLAKHPSLDFDELKSFFGFNKLLTFGFNPIILKVEGAVSNKK